MSIRTLLFLLFCTTSIGQAAVLKSLVVKDDAGKQSIFCIFSHLPSHQAFLLSGPIRAVIDLQHTTTMINFNQIPINHRLIERIRSGTPDLQTLRLVFDLKQGSDIKVTNWKTGMNGTQGLRIDLIPRQIKNLNNRPVVKIQHPQITSSPIPHQYQPPLGSPPPQPKQNRSNNKAFIGKVPVPAPIQHPQVAAASTPHPYQPPASVVNEHHAIQQPIAIHHAPPQSLRDVLVVIDAGHGGKDPGATGPRRNLEKHVTLNIALKLKQLIDKQPGMRSIMTRKGDYYVGLRERLNIARKANADMFVSIHADAFNNRNSNGASVYALSPTGATSEAARWLAEKENYSELGGVDLSGLDDKNGLIRTVLLDLSQTATINAGLQIGDKVLYHLNQMTTLHHNKVEQARFMVLKSPDIPSVLVETGFISNPREEFNLTSPAYQTRLSSAIFEGVKRYFWDSPPHGTRIEAMLGGSNYLVQARPSVKLAFNRRGKSR